MRDELEARLRSTAAAAGVEVFGVVGLHPLYFGLRAGKTFGEFQLGGEWLEASLSIGFDIFALYDGQDELIDAAVELVRLVQAGRSSIKKTFFGAERLYVPIDILPLGHRAKRTQWFHVGGPFAKTYGPERE